MIDHPLRCLSVAGAVRRQPSAVDLAQVVRTNAAATRRFRLSFALYAQIVLMLAAAAWLFVAGRPGTAFFVIAVAVLTFARIPAALGVLIGLRLRKRNGNAQKQ